MRVEVMNSTFRALFPVLQESDPVGRSVDELFPESPERAGPLRTELQRVFDTEQPAHLYETEIFLPANVRRYFHIHMGQAPAGRRA